MAGYIGSYRDAITLVENLPNDNKLALKLGGGKRNVYHRQIKFVSNIMTQKEKLDSFLEQKNINIMIVEVKLLIGL